MAQSVARTHSEANDEKESSVYQTDFSVTNRLLPSYNSNNSHSLPPNLPAPVTPSSSYRTGNLPPNHNNSISSIPGWQNLLPTDQGSISNKHYQQQAWRRNPNISQEQQGTNYKSVGYSHSSSSYHPTQSPDSSTGLTSFSGKEVQSESEKMAATTLVKKYRQAGNHTEINESGNDSDGESSTHSLSSQGDESIDEPKKPKRTRTAYSNHQLDQLELAFSRSHYPDVFTREDLSNKLSIKEDRIQVWFQNRRARYRKQERTGSISLRSKYRQKRLQKLQQSQATAVAMSGTGMYQGYYPSCGTNSSQTMLTSPQAVSPYVHGFTFPSSYIPCTIGGSSTSSHIHADSQPSVQTTIASPGYLPGFNTLKNSLPLPGYVTMGLNQNTGSTYGSAYGPTPPNIINTSVAQK